MVRSPKSIFWPGTCCNLLIGSDKTVCHRARPEPARARMLVQLTKRDMTAESLIRLIEELVDLKIQQYAELNLKLSPELGRLLVEKRETDRRRLQQIRAELIRFLES